MRRVVIALGVLLLLLAAHPAGAQDPLPRYEVFGGYSYLPADGNDFPRRNSSGFQFSLASHLTPWFGLVADLGGHYNTASDLGDNFPGVTAKTSVYEFLFGPRFTLRAGKVSAFVHALGGFAVGSTDLSGFSDTGAAFGGGVGADIDITRQFGVRVQFDLLGGMVDVLEGNTRLGVGGVFRFGES